MNLAERLSKINSTALKTMYELHEKTGAVDNEVVRFVRRLIIGIGAGHPAASLIDHRKSLEKLHAAGLSDLEISKLLGIQAIADMAIVNTIIVFGGIPLAQHIPLDSYLTQHASQPIMSMLANSFVGNYGEAALITRPVYGLAMELVRDLFYWFVVPGLIRKNQALAECSIAPLDPES